jgi:hypothetical protein
MDSNFVANPPIMAISPDALRATITRIVEELQVHGDGLLGAPVLAVACACGCGYTFSQVKDIPDINFYCTHCGRILIKYQGQEAAM